MCSSPVGHNEAVKSPFAAQDVGKEPSVGRGVRTVYLVIRAHHSLGVRPLYRDLKRSKIYLSDGTHIRNAVAHKSVVLTVVKGKVLDSNGGIGALYTGYLTRGHSAGKKRILREILKVTPCQGIALYIRSGTENDVYTVVSCLSADCNAHFVSEIGIKGRGKSDRGRKVGCRIAVACIVNVLTLDSESVRTVGHTYTLDAKPGYRISVHKVGAGYYRRLLLKRHLIY